MMWDTTKLRMISWHDSTVEACKEDARLFV